MSMDDQSIRALMVEVAAHVRSEADGATWFELASAAAHAHRDLVGRRRGHGPADEVERLAAEERYRLLSELLAIQTQLACSRTLQGGLQRR